MTQLSEEAMSRHRATIAAMLTVVNEQGTVNIRGIASTLGVSTRTVICAVRAIPDVFEIEWKKSKQNSLVSIRQANPQSSE